MVFSLLRGSASPAQPADPVEPHAECDTLRHETAIEASLSFLGHDYPCVIRNVSMRGMTITAQGVPLCVGVQILARCVLGRVFTGTIRWHRDGAFGMQFIQPLRLDEVADIRLQLPEQMRPRSGRARLRLGAFARFGDQRRRIEVVNLSVGGLSMTSESELPPGQPLMIEFPELLPIGGHVRWSRLGRCGVMFAKLLPLRAAEEFLKRGGLPSGWLDEVRIAHETLQAA